MNKRQFIFSFFLLLFFIFLGVKGISEPIRYSGLADSLRLKIRLTSHILIPANKIENYRKILDTDIPFALDCRDSEIDLSFISTNPAFQSNKIIVLTKNDSLISASSSIIQVSTNDFDLFELADSINENFAAWPNFSCRELLTIETKERTTALSELINLWKFRSKKPNFILLNEENLNSNQSLIEDINKLPVIFGIVSSDDELLPNVLLKDMPNTIINGYFSLPILGQVLLKPYKAGFQFSPDVIFNAPNNEKNMKVFRAIKLENDFGLSDHFQFRNSVKNIIRSDNEEFIVQNVSFEKDDKQGPVAFFNNAFVDAGLESRQILNGAFTISVWIKPTQLGQNNSILGKGTNFVLKLHNGNLTFTMARIKDYISVRSKVSINEWTHVAIVYSEIEKNLKFYLNGEKTDQIRLIADYTGSDHSLLIGSNLWEEFFVGYMGDVKIWERELNEMEIKTDFQLSPVKNKNWIFEGLGLILLLFASLIYFIFRRKRKITKKTHSVIGESRKEIVLVRNERISCFGKLEIICGNGTDLSLKLSPKLKQLFILIMIHSTPGQKGISSKKLSELLWPGMNVANAKNTRGTSIQNLRQSLADCKGLTIAFQDKLWLLELDNNIHCDYYEVNKLITEIEACTENQQVKLLVQKLVSILKTGEFLPNLDVSWMDSYRDQFNSRLIELCLELLNKFENQELALQLDLAEIISMYDELNESALQTKVQILYRQGKHSLAKSVYENYAKLYTELYNTNYPIEFLDLI